MEKFISNILSFQVENLKEGKAATSELIMM